MCMPLPEGEYKRSFLFPYDTAASVPAEMIRVGYFCLLTSDNESRISNSPGYGKWASLYLRATCFGISQRPGHRASTMSPVFTGKRWTHPGLTVDSPWTHPGLTPKKARCNALPVPFRKLTEYGQVPFRNRVGPQRSGVMPLL